MRFALLFSAWLFASLACFGAASHALASDAHGKPEAKKEGEGKPKDEPAPTPSKPSSLTGNAMPHCEPGQYPAGNICKPAPPGYYAPAETRFLVSCPRGTTSRAGSRAPSECF